MTQVQNVGNQVGMSGMQIINAVQAGNTQLGQQIAQCCCDNRLAICQQTNAIQNSINNVAVGQERGFSSINFKTQKQTCDIQNSIKDAVTNIIAQFGDLKTSQLQDKLDLLLETYNITLEHNQMYVYITNYLLSLYFKSSINDEKQLMFLVKDTIDKNKEGIIFTQWYASMCKLGIPIE